MDDTAEDAHITALIEAAQEHVALYLGAPLPESAWLLRGTYEDDPSTRRAGQTVWRILLA
ncbi:hypothetical protein [Halomonas smyrnensis]|uniref:hypothetical protein n=1 Tax=Halomonas smyrnensis TaxID=720605 RepID=UPI0012EA25A2